MYPPTPVWLFKKLLVVAVFVVYSIVVFPLLSLYGFIVGGERGFAIAAQCHRKVYCEILQALRRRRRRD